MARRRRVAAIYYLLMCLARPALRTEVMRLAFLVDRKVARRDCRSLFTLGMG